MNFDNSCQALLYRQNSFAYTARLHCFDCRYCLYHARICKHELAFIIVVDGVLYSITTLYLPMAACTTGSGGRCQGADSQVHINFGLVS